MLNTQLARPQLCQSRGKEAVQMVSPQMTIFRASTIETFGLLECFLCLCLNWCFEFCTFIVKQ